MEAPHHTRALSKTVYFDGLRGVMASIVCIHHWVLLVDYQKTPIFSAISQYPIAILWNGRIAVLTFYVLSGRVLATSLLKSLPAQEGKLASVFIRRPFRLFLPALGVVLINYVLWKLSLYENAAKPGSLLWTSYFDKFFPHQKRVYSFRVAVYGFIKLVVVAKPLDYDYPGAVIWTLSEEFFGSYYVYILSAITVAIPKNHQLMFGFLITLWHFCLGNFTGLFSIGYFLALLSHHQVLSSHRLRLPFRLILLSIIAVAFTQKVRTSALYVGYRSILSNFRRIFNIEHSAFTTWGNPTNDLEYLIAVMSFIYMVEVDVVTQKLLSTRPVAFLGRVSFAMYLLHPPLFGVIVCLMASKTSPTTLPSTIILSSLPVFIFSIAILLVASWYFTTCVDDRCVRIASLVSHAFLSSDSLPSGSTMPLNKATLFSYIGNLYRITLSKGWEGVFSDARYLFRSVSRIGEDTTTQNMSMQTLSTNHESNNHAHTRSPV